MGPGRVADQAHVRPSPLSFNEVLQPAELAKRNEDGQAHFLFEVRVDEPRIVNACSLRCSSTCCKHLRRKPIFTACWPTFSLQSSDAVLIGPAPPWPGERLRMNTSRSVSLDKPLPLLRIFSRVL